MKPATAVAHNNIPWRDRPYQTVQAAAVIVGLSPATIYAAAAKGRIELRKLGGRTLVPTPDPPPLNGSILKYGFDHEGGPRDGPKETQARRDRHEASAG